MTTLIIAIIIIAIINNSLTFVTPVVTVEAPTANRRILKSNAANRRVFKSTTTKRCILKRNSAKRCTSQASAANRRTHHVERRLVKSNAANRRTRQAGFAHRVSRRLVKGVRVTNQPTQTKAQGHWHVPEAPKGATSNQDVNPLASRFNSAVNNLKARRRALKRLAGELMEFDPEYMFT